MGEHLPPDRLTAALTPEEEAHVDACVRCRGERRIRLAGLAAASGTDTTAGEEAARSLLEGRYLLREVIGAGGMATVYRAWDTTLESERAVKELNPEIVADPVLRARFMTEARTMARLRHPHIVQVHDVQSDGSRVFIVMELLAESLMARVERHGPLEPKEAIRVVADVLDALQLAHDHGVVHRDVKPHNILLDERGVAKLGDFGIARVQDRALTDKGAGPGTPAYMAPEQGEGVDGRADVYAMGATLYVALTGRQPPVARGLEAWGAAAGTLDTGLAEVITRATRPDREDRWPTPATMAAALRSVEPRLPKAPTSRWRARARWIAGGLVSVGLVYAVWPPPTTPPQPPPADPSPSDPIPSILVLPFENRSADPEQEYFSDGLTEDVITSLTRFDQLHVLARNTSFHYKDKATTVPALAKELEVRYVLTGSVQRLGDKVRITGELADAGSGRALWAEHYDRPAKDIFSVQDELVLSVAGRIVSNVRDDQIQKIQRKSTGSLTAYELVLMGRKYVHAANQPDNERAREAFEQAIAADLNYAEAHAGLGRVYYYGFARNYAPVTGQEALTRSLEHFQKSVDLDPDNADTLAYYAAAQTRAHRTAEAAAHLLRALELNPGSADVLYYDGHARFFAGDHAAAIPQLTKALMLDPKAPPNWGMRLGWAHYFRRDYTAALRELDKVIDTKPGSTYNLVYPVRAAVHAEMGRDDLARADVARLRVVDPDYTITFMNKTTPFQVQADRERYTAALRKAGVPE